MNSNLWIEFIIHIKDVKIVKILFPFFRLYYTHYVSSYLLKLANLKKSPTSFRFNCTSFVKQHLVVNVPHSCYLV